MVRRFAPKIGLMPRFGAILAFAIVPVIARAQVNIDQGKPAAEIYQSDCATCHKTARGLADGRNSLMLSTFLREHYTASRDQAAALAAYVLGAGGNAPGSAQKPAQEPKTGEPKTAARPAQEAKPADQEHPAGSNTAKRDARPATANRGQKQEPEATTPQQAAPVVATPAATPAPGTADMTNQDSGATKSAAAPAQSQPGDNAQVPRDNIPD